MQHHGHEPGPYRVPVSHGSGFKPPRDCVCSAVDAEHSGSRDAGLRPPGYPVTASRHMIRWLRRLQNKIIDHTTVKRKLYFCDTGYYSGAD